MALHQRSEAKPPAGQDLPCGADLLAWRQRQLAVGGRAADLDWLVDLGGGLPWTALQSLRLDPSASVRLSQSLDGLEQLWRRHLSTAEPLQYLVGLCPWRDLQLLVAPGVLIPRQETELLVELALAVREGDPPQLWADLGTGSGCIARALAQAWPLSRGLAVELSPGAIAIAQENLRANLQAKQVELLQGSWWEPLRPWWGQLEVVVANPPYIPTAVWADLEPVVKEHEPITALDGGADGLKALRAIAVDATAALAPGGWLFVEHHHDQSTAVQALLADHGLGEVTAHPDLEGTSRFVAARRPLP
ncbi:peptide chain release factor N(5)-glutamine methyltransferase [Cyanobium sp. HWJ4-Hawea]|uniref:peptide chain release factor N(5)-glutamine methyltransferase n=1 Tax=Cyanobium sp. HWJ4-Hawea TaxID=2823713 RepID=UPI0020CCE11F|nr:peptide chain release factor N(5)-glutamine methyltransferase [Cyanobium sp. HWJ4-Hawea]MCP9809876.1 peptide chain release factor N(5)-glutamine methyltransferase [Cyanobium sp. HWJ4-Hawea]